MQRQFWSAKSFNCICLILVFIFKLRKCSDPGQSPTSESILLLPSPGPWSHPSFAGTFCSSPPPPPSVLRQFPPKRKTWLRFLGHISQTCRCLRSSLLMLWSSQLLSLSSSKTSCLLLWHLLTREGVPAKRQTWPRPLSQVLHRSLSVAIRRLRGTRWASFARGLGRKINLL